MKASHKAVLTFAITAISTLSGGTSGSRFQALLQETQVSTASITGIELSQPVVMQNPTPKHYKTTPETDRYFPGLKKFTILPVAKALSEPAW
jgi:hypothetical protein